MTKISIENNFSHLSKEDKKNICDILDIINECIEIADKSGKRSTLCPINHYNEYYYRIWILCKKAGYQFIPASQKDGEISFGQISW